MKSNPPPTVTQIATMLGVSRQAIYRRLGSDHAEIAPARAA